MKKYLKLTSLPVCVSQITSQIVDFFTSWLPVIIDYQLQEVYLNQSLLFTAFYDSLLKVKIYKQGADSAGMKLIKITADMLTLIVTVEVVLIIGLMLVGLVELLEVMLELTDTEDQLLCGLKFWVKQWLMQMISDSY